MSRHRFRGHIAGVGTTSGVRVVVGRWHDTPLGVFADAMVERPDAHRLLLAPRHDVAEFIAATYTFDEVRVEPFEVAGDDERWQVRSPSLRLDLRFGGPTAAGRLLGLVPRRLAESPAWCTVTDPVARLALAGVRTRGTAGGDRREFYGATASRHVTAASGVLEGTDLGSLAPVDPPPRFGFSSTPRTPSVTEVVTTVVSP